MSNKISKRTFMRASAASLAVAGAGIGPSWAATGRLSADVLSDLQSAMEAHVAKGSAAGMVWLIDHAGETKIGHAGTFEMGEGEPMAPDTIFRVASITKPVTAVATMKLVEENVFSLDGPVDPLLPELAGRRVLTSIDSALDDTAPADRPITLRDLLTMRFGHGAITEFPEKYPIQKAMSEAGIAPGPQMPSMSADEYMERLGRLPLAYQPGERFLYNNGLDVAGILIARATGKTLGEVLEEMIFAPLGMNDTGFFVPEDKLDRLPTAWWRNFETGKVEPFDKAEGGRFASPPIFESGAGGLVSTVGDYLKFSRMMINGGELQGIRILKQETVAEMTRNQLTDQ